MIIIRVILCVFAMATFIVAYGGTYQAPGPNPNPNNSGNNNNNSQDQATLTNLFNKADYKDFQKYSKNKKIPLSGDLDRDDD